MGVTVDEKLLLDIVHEGEDDLAQSLLERGAPRRSKEKELIGLALEKRFDGVAAEVSDGDALTELSCGCK